MNRIKKISTAFLLAFFGLGLASCSSKVATSTSQGSSSMPNTSTNQTTIEYNDTDVESGKYMYLDTVYEFNKTNKKLKATKYTSYSQYKTNTGEVVFDVNVKYVDYSNFHAVYASYGNTTYYIFKDGDEVGFSTVVGGETTTSTCVELPDTIAEPEYGTYVSDKKTQAKLGPDGKRISDGQGGYVQEDFYLFVELTATKATLYAGSNSTTHTDTQLGVIDNYVAKFYHGKVLIEIPHTQGTEDCLLTVETATEIDFINFSEPLEGDLQYADYGCSGTMRKI